MSDHQISGKSHPITGKSPGTRRSVQVLLVGLVVAALLLAGAVVAHNLLGGRAQASRLMPQSSEMETALGVRFSRVAVVGDGGLVTLSYVVLDPEKATRFQSDIAHPPVLRSEARTGGTHRVSLMKQGHSMRAGQTYYLVFENTAGALRPEESITIDYGTLHLRHVPVL